MPTFKENQIPNTQAEPKKQTEHLKQDQDLNRTQMQPLTNKTIIQTTNKKKKKMNALKKKNVRKQIK